MDGFWVHRIGVIVMSPDTQMLQPMHSLMSSSLPSSILRGRNGSEIDGLAAPMRSSMPSLIWPTMVSGEANRPTPTTGLVVSCLSPRTNSCCAASGSNRDVPESSSQLPRQKSHRLLGSASMPITSSISARVIPSSSSVLIRQATAARPAAASMVSSRVSRSSRARFSRFRRTRRRGGYSRRDRKCCSPLSPSAAYTYTRS